MQNCQEALLDMSLVRSHKETSSIVIYTSLTQPWTAKFCDVMYYKLYGLDTFFSITECYWFVQYILGQENIILLSLLWLH
jgi:hypothetical protein